MQIECIGCHVMFEEIKLIIYYANGKPVYTKHCKDCTRKRWEKYRDEVMLIGKWNEIYKEKPE